MKNVHVVIRPWIKIDGTLNRRVLDRLLGSVLGHCLGVPGVTMDKIQARFTPALQPLHTLELVHVSFQFSIFLFLLARKYNGELSP
jgi:general transcription factor 3C polypeptide 1